MRKIIAIAGEPGVGKSSLMWKFINQHEWQIKEDVKLVNSLYNENLDLHILGKYKEGETFSGTDRYSMSVQPSAMKFIQNTTSNILFEGDRLTNSKFYEFLLSLSDTEVKFLILNANKDTLNERCEIRGSNQSETFLKSRKTKISNICSSLFFRKHIQIMPNENFEDQRKILDEINLFFS